MKNIQFKALDYTSDDKFQTANYEYNGDEETGWTILRNGENYLNLGPGYKLLKTRSCGVCSTDLDRRFLPFPLPQVIGHEVIAEDLETKQSYVVEINDSYEARGDLLTDAFVQAGIPTHSPERKVLGIDRLPGGFGSYILAPKNAAIPYKGLPDRTAVLGPRRLGSLVISALQAYRLSSGKNFRIIALARRQKLLDLAVKLGADEGILIADPSIVKTLEGRFAIVYDTTSTVDGFHSAIQLAKREVHLKTTNGQSMEGIRHLTELVVDELSILPLSKENLQFHWEKEVRQNTKIFIAPSLSDDFKNTNSELSAILKDFRLQNPMVKIDSGDWSWAINNLQGVQFEGRLPRYDIVIIGSLDEIDMAIRPQEGKEESLVRPRGAILVHTKESGKSTEDTPVPMMEFFAKGKGIRSSRCGDFHLALKLLEENPSVAKSMAENMVSHEYPASELELAFETAKSPDAIKVMVKHG
ncbi:alcohol dehydrogenase catalytic domain-containing protein [Leptospira sp. GIMC2001]|uniref:alcohol dehydrogenase catalytic domain-containing protein n=1 Tax=Leptospira sp. GIMC2001 TaxID=1513297 RepID=UPI00234B907A|nr:alcohol dehydrogenase catalytic domain-containing protein [Leptospira sp. GIMC2001]WCL49426.1 alcohol dehydrogenase catalytic domain-containing protein [Leptospira sp. GIMC2001]